MNWTKEQYEAYTSRRKPSRAQPEQVICDEPVGPKPGEKENPPRVVVRITSYRKRLLDPDNLVGGTKHFIDGLRYAGILSGDRPDQISLEVYQHKSKNERTEIEII